jgi:hypothetical protein
MNEAETRAELIDPALKAAGWGIFVFTGYGSLIGQVTGCLYLFLRRC